MLCCGSRKWRWLIQWTSWNLRDQFMERIFQTSRCWTRELPLLWTTSSRIPSSRTMSASRSRKPQKEDRFLLGRQIAFMIYDYLRLTGAHDTVLDYADLFSVTLHDDNIQEFDTRWDEVLLSVKNTIRWYLGKSFQIEDMWVRADQNRIGIVRHGASSEDIGSQLSKSWKPWWRGEKIRNFNYETLTLGVGELNQEQWSFANPTASSSAPYPQELNPWSSQKSEPIHSSTAEKNDNQTPFQDQRCQSGPSAKDSVIFSGGDYSKNYGADQQRLQISDLHFDKFPTPATFACWKIRFKTEVCTCSQFPTEAMQWIKEVEMVHSVDELRSSSSFRCISMPNLEVLDARIASALNKIIHNSNFKKDSVWRNKRPRSRTVSFTEDRLLTWSTSTSGSLEPTILSKTFPTCSLLFFEMMIFRNSILIGTEFYCLWRIVQIKNTRVWTTQNRIGIVRHGDSSEDIG